MYKPNMVIWRSQDKLAGIYVSSQMIIFWKPAKTYGRTVCAVLTQKIVNLEVISPANLHIWLICIYIHVNDITHTNHNNDKCLINVMYMKMIITRILINFMWWTLFIKVIYIVFLLIRGRELGLFCIDQRACPRLGRHIHSICLLCNVKPSKMQSKY